MFSPDVWSVSRVGGIPLLRREYELVRTVGVVEPFPSASETKHWDSKDAPRGASEEETALEAILYLDSAIRDKEFQMSVCDSLSRSEQAKRIDIFESHNDTSLGRISIIMNPIHPYRSQNIVTNIVDFVAPPS